MTDLTDAQKKKLERLGSVVEGGNVSILEYLNELEDTFEARLNEVKDSIPDLETVAERIKGTDGADGNDGEAGEQGSEGKKGDTGPEGKQGKDGKDGRDGRDGRDGVDGRDAIDGTNGLDGSPDTADDIRNKLELLPEGEKLSIDAIEDLRNLLETNGKDGKGIVMGANRQLYQLLDVQIQGVTNGQLLGYQASTQTWVPVTPGGASAITGLISAGTNVTITGSGTLASPYVINATGGGSFSVMVPTGTVDGTNKSFVFTSAPSVIVVDNGSTMNKTNKDTTGNWTGTTTVSMLVAPTFNIYGF